MEEGFVTLVKKSGTGMHVAHLSPGSKLRGEEVDGGRQIIRPGNVVYCKESDLGAVGRKQFDLVDTEAPRTRTRSYKKASAAVPEPEPKPAQVPKGKTLEIHKRATSNYYDIVNPANPDKPLNSKALRLKEAEAELARLTEGEAAPPAIDEDEDAEE